MKSLAVSTAIEVAVCALVGAVVALVVPGEAARTSALLGVATALALGVVALVLKLQVPALMQRGASELRALVAVTGLAFGLRLLAVGVGALALKQREQSPEAFVLAFFVVYLAQQVVEVRSVVARREPKTTPGQADVR